MTVIILKIESAEEAELLYKGFVHGVHGPNTRLLQRLIMKIEAVHSMAHDIQAAKVRHTEKSNGEEANQQGCNISLVS